MTQIKSTLRNENGYLHFEGVSPSLIQTVTQETMAAAEAVKKQLLDAPYDSELIKLRDDLEDQVDQPWGPFYLMKETHPDADVRAACREGVETLHNFMTALDLDEDIFNKLKTYSEQQPELDPVSARYLKKTMDSYLRNGFRLPSEGRKKLQDLDEEINRQELLFQKNVGEVDSALFFTEEEAEGLPEDYLKARRQEDGTYKVKVTYPDYYPFMKFSKNGAAREKLYRLFNNRAAETNVDLLVKILKLRRERTELLGYETYSQMKLENLMAEKPERVWSFIKELNEKVAPKAESDFQDLCRFAGTDTIHPWDKMFITTKMLREKYDLDENQVKPYFPLKQVLQGLFQTAEKLYGIDLVEADDIPVWHEDVRAYRALEKGKTLGIFYLDLFPRDNKYNHAACFGLCSGKQTEDGYRAPEASLVCNFPSPADGKPSLLTHGNVETFFHEFGHLMHHLLTKAPYAGMAGTSVERDFVEMPSQIMEHWVWEKESLKTFAKHFQTGETIPDELVDKLLAVKNLNSGLDIQQQLFYTALDFTLHDGFKAQTASDTDQLVEQLQNHYTRFPYVKGTRFQASFGHLIGYSSRYYGYLWSRVFADDMFSVFSEKGLYNAQAGRKFRDEILAKGDSEPPMALIQTFLGREPNMNAFLEGLGI